MARMFAFRAPYSSRGFVAPFESNDVFIGRNVFRDYLRDSGGKLSKGGANDGLIDSFDDLRSFDFDPRKVDPLIREFYENTSAFNLDFEIAWNPLLQPAGFLVYHLIARVIQQLCFPPWNSSRPGRIDSEISMIDVDSDDDIDFRGWARTISVDKALLYIGAVHVFTEMASASRPDAYLCITFPLPFSNITAALKLSNVDSGFRMTTNTGESRHGGTYLVFPHSRCFSMLPGFGLDEVFEFSVVPGSDEIRVVHEESWLGIQAFTMRYVITRK